MDGGKRWIIALSGGVEDTFEERKEKQYGCHIERKEESLGIRRGNR